MNGRRGEFGQRRTAFTLVELLVVIGIIAILVAILLPTLRRVRESANVTTCQSNMREVGNALVMYANDNRDVFPDKTAMGSWNYRRRPGVTNSLDPSSYPEWLGLPAVLAGIRYTDYNFGMPKAQVVAGVKAQLAKPRYLSAGNNWLCPSYPARFVDYGNTYTWSIATIMGSATSIKRGRKIDSPSSSNNWVMWDNFSHLPYTPGAIFPTPGPSGYTLAGGVDKWIIPHRSNNGQSNRGVNFLFLDGHVEKLSYSSVGSGSPWVQ